MPAALVPAPLLLQYGTNDEGGMLPAQWPQVQDNAVTAARLLTAADANSIMPGGRDPDMQTHGGPGWGWGCGWGCFKSYW